MNKNSSFIYICMYVIHFYFPEFELRQNKGLIDKGTILLTVEDPQSQVGSGGATINALVAITEYISAHKGYTVSSTLLSWRLRIYNMELSILLENMIYKIQMEVFWGKNVLIF